MFFAQSVLEATLPCNHSFPLVKSNYGAKKTEEKQENDKLMFIEENDYGRGRFFREKSSAKKLSYGGYKNEPLFERSHIVFGKINNSVAKAILSTVFRGH